MRIQVQKIRGTSSQNKKESNQLENSSLNRNTVPQTGGNQHFQVGQLPNHQIQAGVFPCQQSMGQPNSLFMNDPFSQTQQTQLTQQSILQTEAISPSSMLNNDQNDFNSNLYSFSNVNSMAQTQYQSQIANSQMNMKIQSPTNLQECQPMNQVSDIQYSNQQNNILNTPKNMYAQQNSNPDINLMANSQQMWNKPTHFIPIQGTPIGVSSQSQGYCINNDQMFSHQQMNQMNSFTTKKQNACNNQFQMQHLQKQQLHLMNTPTSNHYRQIMSTPSTHSSRFNMTANEGSFTNQLSVMDPQSHLLSQHQLMMMNLNSNQNLQSNSVDFQRKKMISDARKQILGSRKQGTISNSHTSNASVMYTQNFQNTDSQAPLSDSQINNYNLFNNNKIMDQNSFIDETAYFESLQSNSQMNNMTQNAKKNLFSAQENLSSARGSKADLNEQQLNNQVHYSQKKHQTQTGMNNFVVKGSPQLIIHDVWNIQIMNEIHNHTKGLRLKSLDIAKISSEGIIKITFFDYQEALNFGNFLNLNYRFQVQIVFVKDLLDIPEENLNQNQQAVNQNYGSDTNKTISNQSPIINENRMMNSSRHEYPYPGDSIHTIQHSFSSGQNGVGVLTQIPIAQEGLSIGSDYQNIFHNTQIITRNLLYDSIKSLGGGSDQTPILQNQLKEEAESQKSLQSSMGGNDGGPVDLDKILNGQETRTNLMVKNIPCRYTEEQIKKYFNKNHQGRYNDLRLPTDIKNGIETNRSYCFINFRHVLFVYDFIQDKKNQLWPKYESDKKIDIFFAYYQPKLSLTGSNGPNNQEYKMTDQERDELNKILEERKVIIPIEKFHPLQSPNKPKYSQKIAQGHTSSFISGSGLDDQREKRIQTQVNKLKNSGIFSQIQFKPQFQSNHILNSVQGGSKKNHHSNQNLHSKPQFGFEENKNLRKKLRQSINNNIQQHQEQFINNNIVSQQQLQQQLQQLQINEN